MLRLSRLALLAIISVVVSDDNTPVREQVSFKVPMCKNGDVPYLVLGDIWNCDLGCPTTHLCETIDFYNACCPITVGAGETVSPILPRWSTVRPGGTVSTTVSSRSTVETVSKRTTTSQGIGTPANKFNNDKLPIVGPATTEIVQLLPGTPVPPTVGQGYQGPATAAPAGPAPAGPAPAGPAPAGPAPAGPAPAGPAPAGPAPAGPAPAGPGASAPGSGLPPRIATAAYSCTKIPFKKECTTGFPSQLVLRWYLKDGKCCSYPYGHCKGEDDTLTNPGIRTKADCESICVKGDKSQPGAGPAAGGGGGGAAPGAVGPAPSGGGGGAGGAAPTGGAPAPGGAGGATAPGSGLPPRVATAQYSCTKIPFKGTCTTGFPSQLVLRWYLKDGKCCSYPYGHCKGEDDTLTNPGIRTKADCESICVKGDKSQPGAGPAAGGGGGAAAPGGGGPAPSGGGGGGGGAPTGGAPPPGGAAGPGASAPGSGLPPRIATAAYSCTKIPFKKECTTGFPSQLVLRWYLKDGKCCSYPYGHCKGEDDTLTNPGIRTKADCESICIKGDKSQPGGSPGGSPGTGTAPTGGNLPGGVPNQPGAGTPGAGVPAAGGPSPGGQPTGSGLPPRVATAQYSCTKIPFKGTCTTGFPSQLVLRWYLKDGKCCSYPYGHCKGEDDTLTNPGIRTKADCESICVKGDKSQPGDKPGTNVPGTNVPGTNVPGTNVPGTNQPGYPGGR